MQASDGRRQMRPFEYSRATSVAEAIRSNASDTEAKFLAGGSNLIDLSRYGVENPGHVIDITHLPLAHIEELRGGGLRIGALVKNSDLAADSRVKQAYPVLSEALL